MSLWCYEHVDGDYGCQCAPHVGAGQRFVIFMFFTITFVSRISGSLLRAITGIRSLETLNYSKPMA
jgi:hypothetical protein